MPKKQKVVTKIVEVGVPGSVASLLAVAALCVGTLVGRTLNKYYGDPGVPTPITHKFKLECLSWGGHSYEPCQDRHGVPYDAYGEIPASMMFWQEHDTFTITIGNDGKTR